ncbi:TetR/AcrR family transcriptional regulator [Rhizobium sp. BK379]|uniref:TetR/AcrR family transcriptional regulator n=1 Tax=Rhizobium sp. BK379 TaxID=2587059 RepID=UPI001612DA58|nr:TetR/AcrR family transcriptional regulator [Rhizobium sp. BK379]MBB3447176.1 AcrR family transcriptional regulator [Rhizobium sp. BK379]
MNERGRPRSFDRQQALSRAMHLFWQKGFEETSMSDLTQTMGIAPPSLYAAFGSKEALFTEALDLYQATVNNEIWKALEDGQTIAAAIEGFLVNTARAYSRSDQPAGCMIVLGSNPAASEIEAIGADLRQRRAENMSQLMKRFERAVSEGELNDTFDCEAVAVFFATLQNGMSLLARDGGGEAALMAVARSGNPALEGMIRDHRRG